MNVKDLQALIVVRNHAQSLLNGLRADLKMSKEEKSSLMNGLKKVDEVFLKQFESAVASASSEPRTFHWTSTENEEEVLNKALTVDKSKESSSSHKDYQLKAASVKPGLFARVSLDDVTASLTGSRVTTTTETQTTASSTSDGATTVAATSSEIKTIPVVAVESKKTRTKKV